MLIEGSEVVTRQTQLAGRRLTVFGATVFALNYYKVNLSDLEVFGVKDFPVELFDTVGTLILLFMIATLVLNWNADRISFSRWYHTNEVVRTTVGGTLQKRNHPQVILDALKDIEITLISHADGKKEARQRFKEVYSTYTHLEDSLNQQRTDFNTISRYGWFMLNIWYFAVPISMGIAALASLYWPDKIG